MNNLPTEVMIMIFDFLDFSEILKLVIVSKRLSCLVENVCEKRIRKQYKNDVFKKFYKIHATNFLRVIRREVGLIKLSDKELFESKRLHFSSGNIPEEIRFLKNCEEMVIEYSNTEFPEKVPSNLRTLKVIDSRLQNCPSCIEELHMENSIIENFTEPRSLKRITIIDNRPFPNNIYSKIENMSRLKFLIIEIYLFEKWEVHLPLSVRNLKISNGLLQNFPENLYCISELDLRKNKAEKFPETIKALKLESLNLAYNKIGIFPECLLKLKQLKKLVLNNCSLRKMPKDMSTMENLEELNLGNNSLRHVPKILMTIPSLKILRLHNNKIKKMGYVLFNHFNTLVELYFDNNPIEFDERILLLPSLKKLSLIDCGCNKITSEIVVQ